MAVPGGPVGAAAPALQAQPPIKRPSTTLRSRLGGWICTCLLCLLLLRLVLLRPLARLILLLRRALARQGLPRSLLLRLPTLLLSLRLLLLLLLRVGKVWLRLRRSCSCCRWLGCLLRLLCRPAIFAQLRQPALPGICKPAGRAEPLAGLRVPAEGKVELGGRLAGRSAGCGVLRPNNHRALRLLHSRCPLDCHGWPACKLLMGINTPLAHTPAGGAPHL